MALLRGQAWQRGVTGCAAQGRAFRECQSSFGAGHSCTCWRKGALSLQSWASSAVSLLLLLPFLPSPERDPSSTNCHTVKLLSPLLQLGSAAEGMDYFQQSISIWEHISFWCAGSWVLKPLTPRWLPVLLNSVLMQPLPLQPFWTSVSSGRSLLVLMFCVFAISSFVPLLWLSFPI